jgi:hypothetical protein
MDTFLNSTAGLLGLPLEVLTDVCLHLDLRDLVRASEACKRVRHGDGALKSVDLPIKSPVVMALRDLAFPRPELVPRRRPVGCSKSWVAYLARCARQRRCREVLPFAAGNHHSLFVTAAGQLMACGDGAAAGHGDARRHFEPAPVAAMAGVCVVSVAAGFHHSLALGWDGRVYSWGRNEYGQLGHRDTQRRPAPALVSWLKGVRYITAAYDRGVAVTYSGNMFHWSRFYLPKLMFSGRPSWRGLGECACATRKQICT